MPAHVALLREPLLAEVAPMQLEANMNGSVVLGAGADVAEGPATHLA